ncbi:MAG TPA: hypothetical protein VH600_17195 [Burkholderiales bacterium]|jgi:hypothetical protein
MKLAFFERGILKRNVPKRPAIAIAVTLVAAASLVIGRERPALEVVESSPARAQNTAAAPEIDLDKLRRVAEADAPKSDPFAPRSFAPKPRAQRGAAAASAPKGAPPLPFTYIGWVSQDGKTDVYVQRGEELISIAAGQKIEPDYRVDSITDSSIGFTYLPMKTRQVLERAEPEGRRQMAAEPDAKPQVVERAEEPEGGGQALERDPAGGRPG